MSFSNQYRALKLSMGSQSYSRSSFSLTLLYATRSNYINRLWSRYVGRDKKGLRWLILSTQNPIYIPKLGEILEFQLIIKLEESLLL